MANLPKNVGAGTKNTHKLVDASSTPVQDTAVQNLETILARVTAGNKTSLYIGMAGLLIAFATWRHWR